MGQLIEINRKRYFNLEDAMELLPIVRRITQEAYGEVKQLTTQLSYIKDKPRKELVERAIQKKFQHWQAKIGKLGCEAKGMWLVDFDSGEGYYCWHYPEPTIRFYHGYFDGYRGRVKIPS